MFRQQQVDDFLEKTFSDYIGCHPTYTIPLIRAHNFIIRDIGPINPVIRYYIAILATSRHRCFFLVNFLRKQFLARGGDPEWLKGIEHIPSKLRALSNINNILAHQPWLIKASHIEFLTKGQYPWSVSELTHAFIILVHFHSLCSLAFGCKFGFEEPENFDDEGSDFEEVEIEEVRFDVHNGSSKIKKIVKRSPASRLIVERCRQLEQEDANLAKIMNSFKICGKRKRKKSFQSAPIEPAIIISEEDGDSATVILKEAKVETMSNSKQHQQDSDDSGMCESEFKVNTWSEDEWKKHNFDVFIDDPEFTYVDFAKRGRQSDTSTYRIQDYQWDDQGYCLLNYLYPDIASFLDEKFKVGCNLTYYTLGPKTNIDTSPFRRAIWNYIQSIYGIRHDDYNYREVNILLERNLKCYIKNLSCFPESLITRDFRSVMKGFRVSEKIHVIIMVAEARLQAEILYALRALMEYMKLAS